MSDYKKIFADHGYSLFEVSSVESAIIAAMIEGNIRYLYGIPVMFENVQLDYDLLIRLSKKSKVWEELQELFYVSSKIVQNKKLAKKLKSFSKNMKKTKFNISEFKKSYNNTIITKQHKGFVPSISYVLSSLFAKKQIEILYKLKTGEKLTKTEKEYFSRVIKKKLNAIKELYPLAKELLK